MSLFTRFTRLALSATLCAASIPWMAGRCHANNTWVQGAGGSAQPVRRPGKVSAAIREHPSIRMVSEVVHIKLPERIVHVRFVFRNDGSAALAPSVKAPGGRATYDPCRKQMRVWLPPLPPAATRPQEE